MSECLIVQYLGLLVGFGLTIWDIPQHWEGYSFTGDLTAVLDNDLCAVRGKANYYIVQWNIWKKHFRRWVIYLEEFIFLKFSGQEET